MNRVILEGCSKPKAKLNISEFISIDGMSSVNIVESDAVTSSRDIVRIK